ncbi:MAG: amidohydrolase [Streptosporangiales bacterium]|nr:amidohydrolase [Streptosporangiales bacterium]MBO0892377.1 amidohydrolase [Acidothermales bacterium]
MNHAPVHSTAPVPEQVLADLSAFVEEHEHDLVTLRRDLHRHPELGDQERRTTALIVDRLRAAGLHPVVLPTGTGVVCDVGPDSDAKVALRADIDALPLPDEKDVPYRSAVDGVCHACGHDVHTTILMGTALFLAREAEAGRLPAGVRLLFQPAEEVIPGGAEFIVNTPVLDGVSGIYAVHCDPTLPVGKVGLRVGAITASTDRVRIALSGPGGHTSRPHLTADLVYALGAMITQLPAALSRRVDPRAGMALVWGRVEAGRASNAIPDRGEIEGTLRCLDDAVWHDTPDLVKTLVESIAAPFGVGVDLHYHRGVPPVVNDAGCVRVLEAAATEAIGPEAVGPTRQSLGGEDFAWYLDRVPGALARLGTRHVDGDVDVDLDIHRGTFDVDERAIGVGVKLMATAAYRGRREPQLSRR